MTMQSKVSSPIEVTPTQPFSWLLALAILILGIVLGIFATSLSTQINETKVVNAPERLSRDFPIRPNLLELEKRTYIVPQNALEAESARYSSLGLFYAAGREAQTQRALTAEAARYNGLELFYAAGNSRAIAAEAARYNSLGQFYAAENESDERIPNGVLRAENALAAYPQSERELVPIMTGVPQTHDREYGLARFDLPGNETHTLAWPPRPSQFVPLSK